MLLSYQKTTTKAHEAFIFLQTLHLYILLSYQCSNVNCLMSCLHHCRAHIVIATPGRLVDMFGRKHTAFDLSASVKAVVKFLCHVFILQSQNLSVSTPAW